MPKDKNISKLNKDQKEAVEHGKGPLLIIAGAGTGKTSVITEKIKYLITKELAKPEEILALTFTEKAATEMEERVDSAMPLSYGDIWIMTFHSFCDRILREHGISVGLPNYKLMTTVESIDLIKKNIFDFNLNYFKPLGNPNKFVDGLLTHFSRLQDEVITPKDYLDFAKNYTHEDELEVLKVNELASAYDYYDKLKIREGKFDFGDLIIKSIGLLKVRPNILKDYQKQFKYILVDEFQDTNFAQNELVNMLVNEEKNITVVGDDNQSIYRFRGAAISNILQFKNNFPEAKIITLNKNYRSTQIILDSSYQLIKHNDPDTLEARLGISKKLISEVNNKNIDIEFIHSNNSSDEAQEVVKKIISLTTVDCSPFTYSDIAILVRANAHADPFIRELERQGIPHQFLGPSKLFEKEEVIDLISFLKVLYNPEDSIALYRLLSSEIFDTDTFTLIKYLSASKKNSTSLFEELENSNDEKIIKILDLIKANLKEINKKSAGEILYDYINEIGLYQKIIEKEDDIKAKNIQKFFEKIKSYEDENKNVKLREIVDYIMLLEEIGEGPVVSSEDWGSINAVNILTVHSSKGLEFPIVFLVNLVSERFPSRERHEQIPISSELIKEKLPEGDFHLEEERRLFYVGMTRAKERLYFTAADFYGDGKRKKKISPFVLEALGETVNSEQSIVNRGKININRKNDLSSPTTVHRSQKINYLSVSQIETFKTCPLHYKLKYIYKIPTDSNASANFGTSIHNTLKTYFQDKGDVLKIYNDNFIQEGYLNKKHKEEFFDLGKKYLTEFVKSNDIKKIKTIALEKDFKIKIDNTLTIGGKIDRLDGLGNDYYEVIDYKTGENVPSQKDVNKNLQLAFYAIAVSFLYKVEPEKIKLSLYYFKNQEKISTTLTKKDIDKVKKEILEIRDEIESSDFKCNNNYFCETGCEYSMFCKSKTL